MVEHVGLIVCGLDYDLAVMRTVLMAQLWALGLVPDVLDLEQILYLLRSDMCWGWAGQTLDALWTSLCLLGSLPNDM